MTAYRCRWSSWGFSLQYEQTWALPLQVCTWSWWKLGRHFLWIQWWWWSSRDRNLLRCWPEHCSVTAQVKKKWHSSLGLKWWLCMMGNVVSACIVSSWLTSRLIENDMWNGLTVVWKLEWWCHCTGACICLSMKMASSTFNPEAACTTFNWIRSV